MSVVQPLLPGARVLDLFAGSGALGLEALSRGAASADFVEDSAPALRALRTNLSALGAADRARVHRADALRFVRRLNPSGDGGWFDVAFADPPYGRGLAADVAEAWVAEPFAAVLGIEHAAADVMPPGGETRRYGTTALTFYKAAPR